MAMSRFDGCKSLITSPSMRISPDEIVSSPAIVLSNVDLPQPDGPTSTRKPPFSSVRSMPLRISREPKRLRKESISRNAMALSLHGAGHQAAHEVAAADDVDEEGRGGGDDRRRHVDVVFDNARRGVDEIVEGDGHGRRIAGREGRPKQE